MLECVSVCVFVRIYLACVCVLYKVCVKSHNTIEFYNFFPPPDTYVRCFGCKAILFDINQLVVYKESQLVARRECENYVKRERRVPVLSSALPLPLVSVPVRARGMLVSRILTMCVLMSLVLVRCV